MRHKLGIIVALLANSCATAVPLKTVDDIAHEACGMFFARERGISFVDAAQAFCTGEEALRPFVQGLKNAGTKARAAAVFK